MAPGLRGLAARIDNSGGLGRYPANVLHDNSDAVVALFPDSAGQLAAASTRTDTRKTQNVYGAMAHGSGGQEPRSDSGSAARFFNSFPADEVPWPLAFYHSKAGKADRAGSKHPTVKPIGLLRHLIRHICPPGGTVLDPFAGSGTTAEAARLEGMDCVLMEAEEDYLAFLRQRFVSEIAADTEDIFA
jgi:site-specific DNA-methyltransferase (adenine-specific)